ncbi:MAG: hypothetical protein KF764_19805 [Labilithrix sp.]|nr:hypothetical protein [Labilithrix sp.]MBX3222841.1 hypothetical protein [Labilithrix sp.]
MMRWTTDHPRLVAAIRRASDARRPSTAAVQAVNSSTEALAERMLAREAFHHAVLDGIEMGIVTTDPSGTITFVNRTGRDLLHLSEASGGDVRGILGLRRSPEELLQATPKLAYVLTTLAGHEIDLELSVSRADGRGGEAGYFFIFRDMREEKTRSAERERFERLVAIGTMVAGFAHEVRNPVAALRSLAESLAEELSDAKVTVPHVSRMLQVLERIERLVRTSLQFGRPAAPRRTRKRPWTLVAEALGETGVRTRALGGEIRLDIGPELPDVFVDDTQLVQVLVILIDNALDSTGSPGGVLVRVVRGHSTRDALPLAQDRAKDDSPPPNRPVVRFEVRDNGPGVPAEILGRIFDPFFTTKASGTGLGLSIAQHIVSENGGSLEVSSPRGGPTTFAVVIPAS